MKLERLSIIKLCLLVGVGAILSMLAIIIGFYVLLGDTLILWSGAMLTVCALIWMFLLVLLFGKWLSAFTSDLCRMLDNMISGNEEPVQAGDKETLFARPVTDQERTDFLQGIRSQTDKLDFLFQALVKTSRLETGDSLR